MSPDSSPDSHATPDTDALAREVAAAGCDPTRQFGRYLILSELGHGGMGVVYRAWDPVMQRLVAIKTLTEGPHASPELIQRFVIEARSSARLQHPGIIGVHEVGEHQGIHFIAMDLVAGKTLKHHFIKGMASRDALQAVLEVTLALAHAHAHGIVHRDVKPDNVVVNDEGRAILMDFGLAKDLGQGGSLTATGQHLGTPSYMAPEQIDIKTGTIGPTADIYALGATLYRALCGRPPFSATSSVLLFKKVLMDTPPPPRQINPQVPANLEALVLRCLEKKPANRYPSATALAEDLRRFQEGQPLSELAMPQAQSDAPESPEPPASEAAAKPTEAAAKPGASPSRLLTGPTLVSAATVCVFALMGLMAVLADRRQDEPEDQASAAAPPTSGGTVAINIWTPSEGLVTNDPVVDVSGEVTAGQANHIWVGDQKLAVNDRHFQGQVRLQAGADGLVDTSYPLAFSSDPDARPLTQMTVHLDRTAPKLEISSPQPDQVVDAKVTVKGSVHDPQLASLRTSNGKTVDVSADGRFAWQAPLPEADGRFEIRLTAHDRGGNTTEAAVAVLVDRYPPVVRVTTPEDGALLSQAAVTVQGQVIDAQPAKAWLNGQELELSPDGRFETQFELTGDGDQELRLEAEDAAGKRADPETRRLVVDRTPPVLTLEVDKAAMVTNHTKFSLRGRVEDAHPPATVNVGDQEVPLDSNGHFSAKVMLQEGANDLEITCRDGAGNAAAPLSLTVNLDNTPPAIELDAPMKTYHWGSRPLEVAGRVSEQGCRLTLNGEPVKVIDGRFSLSLKLERGTNRLRLEAMDQAGNRQHLTSEVELLARRPRKPKGAWWDPPPRQLGYAAKHDLPLWLDNEHGMRFVLIPPGTFTMGSPPGETGRNDDEQRHRVHISRGFYLQATELTNGQFRRLGLEVGSQYWKEFGDLTADELPTQLMYRGEVTELCQKLTKAANPLHGNYRLPTEAEWEYACRAGTQTAWFWGDDLEDAHLYANLFDPSIKGETPNRDWGALMKAIVDVEPIPSDDGHRTIAPVASYKPNPWGLFDMAGNVSEKCGDLSADYPSTAQRDPFVRASKPASDFVTRGGSFVSPPGRSRSAARLHRYTGQYYDNGFRLVMEIPWWKPTKEQVECAAEYKVPVWFETEYGMRFVLIPEGKFMMGSPPGEAGRDDDERQHRVEISHPFYLQTTEVTRAQYRRLMAPAVDVWQATINDDMDTIRAHFTAGTDIDEPHRHHGATPILLAIERDLTEVAKLLIDAGANVNMKARNKEEGAPLHWAAAYGRLEIAAMLIAAGADVNSLDASVSTPLDATNATQWTSDREAQREIARLLEEHGGKRGIDLTPRTGLWKAAADGDIEAIRALLADGADINERSPCFRGTPLHIAIWKDQPEAVKLLIDRGASLRMKSRDRWAGEPLHWAAAYGHPELVAVLIDAGAKVNVRDTMGSTPLDAVGSGLSDDEEALREVARLLVEQGGKRGADVPGEPVPTAEPNTAQRSDPQRESNDRRPAPSLGRDQAEEFSRKLGEMTTPVPGSYRLPTEAEWEYACRAGTKTAWFWGDDLDSAHLYENLLDPETRRQRIEQNPEDGDELRENDVIPSDDDHRDTAPVASYRPNPWGLYDMVGNLQEWCSDAYAAYPEKKSPVDPKGPEERDQHDGVIRGGAFLHSPLWSRAARRGEKPADYRGLEVGFRLVLEIAPPQDAKSQR